MCVSIEMCRKRLKKRRIIGWCIYAVLVILVGVRILWNIQYEPLMDNDETWHIGNAVEMFRSGNWLINTWKYQPDYYNSKPPLSLWMILMSFRAFGVSLCSARIPSMLAGIAIFICLMVFMKREYGSSASVFWGMAFLLLDACFDFHMFRTANMDSLFNLFLAISVIGLYKSEKNFHWIILYGAALGLTFLTKGPLMILQVLIGVLELPKLFSKWRWKDFGTGVLCALTPVLFWAVLRYRYDGLAFLREMFIGEVGRKTSSMFTVFFLKEAFSEKVFLLLYLLLFCRFLQLLLYERSLWKCGKQLMCEIKDTHVFWFWFLVPLAVHTVAGTPYAWYGYPSYIAAALLAGIFGGRIFESVMKHWEEHGLIQRAFVEVGTAALLIVCICYTVQKIRFYPSSMDETGGNPDTGFRNDAITVSEEYGDKYQGKTAFIQSHLLSDPMQETTSWRNEQRVYSEIYCDWNCVDEGGIQAFLDTSDCVLVLNKDLWDQYANVLFGYVILTDNETLIFRETLI